MANITCQHLFAASQDERLIINDENHQTRLSKQIQDFLPESADCLPGSFLQLHTGSHLDFSSLILGNIGCCQMGGIIGGHLRYYFVFWCSDLLLRYFEIFWCPDLLLRQEFDCKPFCTRHSGCSGIMLHHNYHHNHNHNHQCYQYHNHQWYQ